MITIDSFVIFRSQTKQLAFKQVQKLSLHVYKFTSAKFMDIRNFLQKGKHL